MPSAFRVSLTIWPIPCAVKPTPGDLKMELSACLPYCDISLSIFFRESLRGHLPRLLLEFLVTVTCHYSRRKSKGLMNGVCPTDFGGAFAAGVMVW
jgi:hypothetical protein